VADEVGTYWYHSHQGMQKMDGLFGAVIVYDPAKPPPPAFNLVVSDWLHIGATAFASTYTGPKYPAGSYSRKYYTFVYIRTISRQTYCAFLFL